MLRRDTLALVIILLLSAAAVPAAGQSAGAITGTVTDAATGAPLGGISIIVYRASGDPAGQTGTNYLGIYTMSGLAPGTYYVRTSAGAPYVNKLYNDLPCPIPGCTPTTGTAVNVTAGATTGDIDFGLVAGGTITGIVSAAGTGEPIAGVRVQAYTAQGTSAGISGTTDADGTYTATWLETGSYYLKTSYAFPYLDELYDNVPCPDGHCDIAAGTAVSATAGAVTSNINIALTHGGTITGTVTDAATGAPREGITVWVVGNGTSGLALTNAEGVYSVTGLRTGTYYAYTTGAFPYMDELYDNLPCKDGTCTITSGTGISVTAGETTPGIDFALTSGGAISGIVTDACTGLPIPNIYVRAFLANGSAAGPGISTNLSGGYTLAGLSPGTYYVRTSISIQYLDELYDNIPCPNGSCSVTSGTAVAVTLGTTTSGIDFALLKGGTIAGTATVEGTATPVPDVGIDVYAATGEWAGSTSANGSGGYALGGLSSGTYYVRASNRYPYLGELYNNVPCPGGACALTAGTSVSVTACHATPGIDFSLALGGSIAGKITSRETGAPIANAQVGVLTTSAGPAGSGSTDTAGVYTVNGLAPGTYYVRAGSAPDFRGALYNDKPCHPDCDLATGTGVVVSASNTTAGIDFALDRSGVISGTVRNDAGAPVASVVVMAFNATGAAGGQSVTDASGGYSIPFLEPGTYYVRTQDAHPYLGELYDGKPCSPSCLVTQGTPVTVSLNHTTSGIDFGVSVAGSIAGTVRRGVTGPPLADVQVTVFNASGGWAGLSTTDASGAYVVSGLSPGTWYVRASRGLPFLDQMYDGRSCMGADCVPANGTGVAVTAGSVTGGIDFGLRTAARSDLDGDLKSDILWRHASGGDVWLWPMDGTARLPESHVETVADTSWQARALGDVDASTTADVVWRNTVTGEVYVWLMNGATPAAELYVSTVDVAYDIAGTGDFDGDGRADILWRNPAVGDLWLWRMDGATIVSQAYVDTVDLSYAIKGLGDLNGDLKTDVVWQGAAGDLWAWLMNGAVKDAQSYVETVADASYQLQQAADFDGDLKADLLWWNTVAGDVWVWRMNGATVASQHYVGLVADTDYRIQSAGDYDGDGKADILWRNIVAGDLWVWLMNGPVKASEAYLGTVADQGYQIVR